MTKLTRLFALLITIMLLITGSLTAQITITADSVRCGDTSTTLRASLLGEDSTSSGIRLDDDYSGVVPIGFTFNYYGTNYSRLVIGDNGVLNFDTTLAGSSCPYVISAALAGNPSVFNCICGPWCDVDVRFGGLITYSTVGVAPYRRFVATWCRAAMYSCTSQYLTTQIILSETTNLIEVHIGHKDTCTGWNGAYAIVGVQNATGTASTAAPSRDFPTVWYATREGWRFTPSGTTYTVSSIPYAPIPYRFSPIYWFDATTNAYLGTGPTLNVTPPGGSHTYYAAAKGCADSTTTYFNADLASLVGGPTGLNANFTTEYRPGCVADTIKIRNFSSPSGNISVWSFGDGTADSGTLHPTHVYRTPGTYTIVLKYRDGTFCYDTAQATVTTGHPLLASFTGSPVTACVNTPVNFVNNSIGTAPVYDWVFGDGYSSAVKNPAHSYAQAGNYKVILTVTDSFNCKDDTSLQINAISVDVKTNFKDTIVCLTDSMIISAAVKVEPTGTTGRMLYQWTPSYPLSNDTVLTTRFRGIGFFILNFTATILPYGCSASGSMTIDSKPPLQLTNVTVSQSIPLGNSVQLFAMGGDIYVWSPNDGTLTNPNVNNPIATPVDSVTKYRVISMTKYGCRDTAYVTITTTGDGPAVTPTAFTPNNDGKNDVFKPFGLRFQKLVDFRVFNRWGEELFHSADFNRGWDGTYNGEPQDMGVYYYVAIVALPDGGQKTIKGEVTLIR